MRVPVSWLAAHLEGLSAPVGDVAEQLLRAGLEVEAVHAVGSDIHGVVVGRVVSVEELTGFKKPIRFCEVDTGAAVRPVVCGATNFAAGALVAVAVPGAVLPGGFEIGSRRTYGRQSEGMICSARELGLGDDHTGILVLAEEPGESLEPGADLVATLGLRDDVIELAVTPDRGYALSMRGVAREVATAFRLPFSDPADVRPAAATGDAYDIRIDDSSGCDRFAARTVDGLDPSAASPRWMRRRLSLAGMRPVSLAVDVTNYVMLDLGQPLHAFDLERLRGPVVVRRARSGETLRTLDGVERTLDTDDLCVTDDSGPVALAGVMGGAATEVTGATRRLLLEAAHWEAASVARTARRHRLPSEASRRFERGVDDALGPAALETAVRLLTGLGGAGDPGAATDVDLRASRPVIELSLAEPERVAGRPYAPEVVRRRLADVGCAVAGAGPVLGVTPPSWRPDLTGGQDLVEEIVRLEGYETLPVLLPAAPAGRGLTREQHLRRLAARALAGAGYVEVLTAPFLAPDALEAFGLAPDDPRRRAVRLANPLSEEESTLRTTLLPGLLAALARNVGRGMPDVALTETGLVFRARPAGAPARSPGVAHRPSDAEIAALDATLPEQPRHVAVALAGRRVRSSWWGDGRDADWADAVDAARTVADAVGVDLVVRRGDRAPWHPGRCAELVLAAGDGVPAVVGWAGELHPGVVAQMGLPARTCAMELDLDAVLAAAAGLAPRPAPVVSAYPPATRDVALVVGDDTPAGAVLDALRVGAGPLLESARLFDVYAGAQLPAGRRSLAFALRFRAADRTLTDEEVSAAVTDALSRANETTGAVLRS